MPIRSQIDPIGTGAFFDGTPLLSSSGRSRLPPAALIAADPSGTVDVPGASSYITNITLPTSWREELVRVDHNINDHNRLTFRYIHDSWNTIEPGPIWDCVFVPDRSNRFNGPGVSMVARLTSTISPTLLNEFVASYTTDHISFQSVGLYQRPANFPNGLYL